MSLVNLKQCNKKSTQQKNSGFSTSAEKKIKLRGASLNLGTLHLMCWDVEVRYFTTTPSYKYVIIMI